MLIQEAEPNCPPLGEVAIRQCTVHSAQCTQGERAKNDNVLNEVSAFSVKLQLLRIFGGQYLGHNRYGT